MRDVSPQKGAPPKLKRRVTTAYVSFPEGRSRLGDVYFIACDNRFVKIGFTDDIEMRLAELQPDYIRDKASHNG